MKICTVKHWKWCTWHRKASAKNSSKLNKFLHSEVNLLIQLSLLTGTCHCGIKELMNINTLGSAKYNHSPWCLLRTVVHCLPHVAHNDTFYFKERENYSRGKFTIRCYWALWIPCNNYNFQKWCRHKAHISLNLV